MANDTTPHQHPDGNVPHRHGEGDELATHGSGDAARRQEGEQTVQLREEELRARKTPVEAGTVSVRKDVVEEPRSLDVSVAREEVTIDRRPVERRPSEEPVGAGGESISVPVMEEQVSVEKRPVVTEEITIDKRQVQDTETVSATIQREEARVETKGDVSVEPDRGR